MVAKKRATKKKAAASKSKYIEYNGSNFSKILPYFKGGPAVVINILVHMNGCGPCQRIMGPYKRAVSKASSDAANVSVERQQLDKFNEDIQRNVSGAPIITVPSFPHMIQVKKSGEIINATTPSPSTIRSLTSNDQKALNRAMNDIPIMNNESPVPPTSEDMEAISQRVSDDLNGSENAENAENADDLGLSATSGPMAGGYAYATLALVGRRLRSLTRQRGMRKRSQRRRSQRRRA